MTKQNFLNELAAALHQLPREERYRTLSYYDELIDDRMEDGQSEEEAVDSLGDPELIAREILGEETPQAPVSTGRKAWIIALLILGFPLWGTLLIAGVSVLLSVYICLFVPVIVLGALAIGFLLAAILGVVGLPFLILDVGVLAGGLPAGLFQLGLSIALLGLSVLCALGFYFTGKATVNAGRSLWRWFRRSVTRQRRVTA